MSLAPTPGARRARARAVEREEREEAARAARHAASFGPCAACKVDVGPDGMHAWSCTEVPTSRRANGGRCPHGEWQCGPACVRVVVVSPSYVADENARICDVARSKVRDAAMHLARMGLSPETIRAAMADMATTEAARAAEWAAKQDAE